MNVSSRRVVELQKFFLSKVEVPNDFSDSHRRHYSGKCFPKMQLLFTFRRRNDDKQIYPSIRFPVTIFTCVVSIIFLLLKKNRRLGKYFSKIIFSINFFCRKLWLWMGFYVENKSYAVGIQFQVITSNLIHILS